MAAVPVVAGNCTRCCGEMSDSGSDCGYERAASHIAASSRMEAGDIEAGDDVNGEVSLVFGDMHWDKKDGTLAAGDFGSHIQGTQQHAFGFENFNFGIRRKDSPGLKRACANFLLDTHAW